MSRRVLKFTVHPERHFTAFATADEPRFLAVGWQEQELVVWVEAAVGTEIVSQLIAVPTGGGVPDGAEYVGTAQTYAFGPALVMHVYRTV